MNIIVYFYFSDGQAPRPDKVRGHQRSADQGADSEAGGQELPQGLPQYPAQLQAGGPYPATRQIKWVIFFFLGVSLPSEKKSELIIVCQLLTGGSYSATRQFKWVILSTPSLNFIQE